MNGFLLAKAARNKWEKKRKNDGFNNRDP